MANPVKEVLHVEPRELLIAACAGAIFGLLGYFVTRHLNAYLDEALPK